MKAFVAIGTLAALLALPGAMAVVSTEGILPAEFGAPTYYVGDDNSVWQESNHCAGLQTAAGHSDLCGDYDADTGIFDVAEIPVPAAPGTPEVPAAPELPALPSL